MKKDRIQRELCWKFSADFLPSPEDSILGISINVKDGIYPIHGLRHPVEGNTNGWYIWAGEYSENPDFFVPLHVAHVNSWNPLIEKYLGLAPGWRFLIAPNHEDVWQDLTLLEV
ncbi:MAG: hypothetical protein H6581_25510 [Bacteroidia bacterium]|nr:hypothetical protein [Bacteroidia bacterium]